METKDGMEDVVILEAEDLVISEEIKEWWIWEEMTSNLHQISKQVCSFLKKSHVLNVFLKIIFKIWRKKNENYMHFYFFL